MSDTPLPPKPPVPPDDQEPSTENGPVKEHWYQRPDDYDNTAWETRKLFVAAAIGILLTLGLLWVALSTLKDNRISADKQSIRDSVTSVRDSVTGARDSIRLISQQTVDSVQLAQTRNRDSVQGAFDSSQITMSRITILKEDTEQRRRLRAYIAVLDNTNPDSTWSDVTVAKLTLKNCGATPASQVRDWIDIDIADSSFHGLLDTAKEKGQNPSVMTLAPGQEEVIPANAKKPIGATDVWGILHHTKILYLRGIVEYLDIFGTKHYYHFKYRSGEGKDPLHLEFTPDWNDAN